MRAIISNQKKERDILLSRPYLTRHTQYDVDNLLASKQIKLITGPRRTGKSTEALLMLKGSISIWIYLPVSNVAISLLSNLALLPVITMLIPMR